MKKVVLNTKLGIGLIAAIFAGSVMTSCTDKSEEQSKKLNEMEAYITARTQAIENELEKNEEEIDAEFEKLKTEFTKDTADMKAEIRERYNNTVSSWQTYKTTYKNKVTEKLNASIPLTDDLIRKTLVLDNIRLDYADLPANKLLSQYEKFVSVVEKNKDSYSKEQWQVINNNWKALNGRMRQLKKEVSADVENKILSLRVKYTGIKAVNRPFAESEDEK